MHPQSVGYQTIQYFNPRLNPHLNLRIKPTGALYHLFFEGSRRLLIKRKMVFLKFISNETMKKYIDKEKKARYHTVIPNND